MSGNTVPWRRVAEAAGLTRGDDLPLILWPVLWAAWFATAGEPHPWSLLALVMALLLARSAAWAGFLPEQTRLAQVWQRRRVLILGFGLGALCFALPLGRAGWLVPLALVLAAAWFQVRRRTYLSDPLLALALMLPPLAAWIAAGGTWNKPAGLTALASALWSIAVLLVMPLPAGGASLAAVIEPRQRPFAAGLLKLTALMALWMAGRQAQLGGWFLAGLAVALLLTAVRTFFADHVRQLPDWGWEAVWGGVIFAGLAVQLAAAARV